MRTGDRVGRLCAKSGPSKPPAAGSIGALSSEASVVDRQPSGAIEQFAIDQLMAAKSKEGLQQLFVQHAHNNRGVPTEVTNGPVVSSVDLLRLGKPVRFGPAP
jgi:hypothetical protein